LTWRDLTSDKNGNQGTTLENLDDDDDDDDDVDISRA
jgi:hypothetical protein